MCCARVCARAPANLRACRFDREGAGRRGAADKYTAAARFSGIFFFLKKGLSSRVFFFFFLLHLLDRVISLRRER